MMRARMLLGLAAALWAVGSVGAADLDKIDRAIAKEPAYKNKPKYCLLVFGEQAKTRVWLVQDGDVLYVDRNANGDLTEKDERVALKQNTKDYRSFEAGDIHDGALTHTGLSVIQMRASTDLVGNADEWKRVKQQGAEPWVWWVRVTAERAADDNRPLPKRIGYVSNGDGLGMLLFADRSADAPIIHLNGPWTLGLQDRKQLLTAGHSAQLQIGVGTQGVGPGTFSFVLYPNTIPADAYPVADIAFPSKTESDKSIRRKYTLKQRC
ncbi:MAG: hypothetical protein ACYC3I_15425 [Gemmataceae bacterium]